MRKIEEIKKALKEHRKELEENYKLKEIGIFGSYVRGEQKKGSDLDIIVDFYEVPDLFKLISLERYLERILKEKIDLVRKPAIREELRERILKEAVYI